MVKAAQVPSGDPAPGPRRSSRLLESQRSLSQLCWLLPGQWRSLPAVPVRDRGLNLGFCVSRRVPLSCQPVDDDDVDVACERRRVLRGDAENDLLKIENLTKVLAAPPSFKGLSKTRRWAWWRSRMHRCRE